jgi:hypothetical protein
VVGFGVGSAALLAACNGDDDPLGDLLEDAESADWDLRPGVEIVTLSGAEPGQTLTLYDETGDDVVTTPTDDKGRAHFAYVLDEPFDGTFDEAIAAGVSSGETLKAGEYVILAEDGDEVLASERFTVLGRDDVPETSLYEGQELTGAELDILGNPVEGTERTDGYQYIEMRDGVMVSVMVRFPDKSFYGDGPWPTVIELSGYGPSNPEAEEPGSRIARSLGYATVSVNLRGTGCSGGVFETFNPAQMADGYDIVETVARQDWVLHNQVGMVGLSYSGITQLFTAATQPPSLAAVTAQSVIADPWMQQWPGGIYNDGFTKEWLDQREAQSGAGSGWVADRIDGGDETCQANVGDQELNIDFSAFGRALEMRPPDADARDLRRLVSDIDTAVFVSGAFQDEQTGAQFGSLLDNFDNARVLRAGIWNGRHPDGYSTMNVMDVFEFLELYVAERTPQFPEDIRGVVESELGGEFGFPDSEIPPNRLGDEFGDDYEAALAFFEDEDPIRLVFGSGLGGADVGAPGGADEVRLPAWPPPEAEARSWSLAADGELADEVDSSEGEATFDFDPDAGSTRLLEDDYSVLEPLPDYDWTEFPDGTSTSFETAAFEEDVVITGPGYAELDISVRGATGRPVDEADIQVAISEVREDGVEHLVQNGWLRLGHRAVDDELSTEFDIAHPFTAEAYERLPRRDHREMTVQVPIPSTGHVFGEGSKLRLTVSSPGRNSVRWTFEPPEEVDEDTTYTLGFGGESSSALVLPVSDIDVEMPEDIPCPGLRGIPCREDQT